MNAGITGAKCAVTPRGFRIAEAAVYMGVSQWFAEREIRAGRLPALELCRHYTLLKEDLDAHLDDARRSHPLDRHETYALRGGLGQFVSFLKRDQSLRGDSRKIKVSKTYRQWDIWFVRIVVGASKALGPSVVTTSC